MATCTSLLPVVLYVQLEDAVGHVGRPTHLSTRPNVIRVGHGLMGRLDQPQELTQNSNVYSFYF
jgi:hypothetical protein